MPPVSPEVIPPDNKTIQEEKMSKTLFTAALAFVLSIGGFALSADDVSPIPVAFTNESLRLVAQSSNDFDLKSHLATLAADSVKGTSFGYKKNGEFVSLATLMQDAEIVAEGEKASATISIPGKFQKDDVFQFGYDNGETFEAISPTLIASDPAFNAGYNIDSFYHLDFSQDPFNGKFDILVMGEPLPASTVTMLVALAAAAALLLFRNRKTRARFSAQA